VSEREDEMIGDGLIDRVTQELRRPVRLDPALDARVMEEIRGGGPGLWSSERTASGIGAAWRWLVRPRTVRVSPLAGLAAAAGIAGIAMLGAMREPPAQGGNVSREVSGARATGAAAAVPALQAPGSRPLVQFVLLAPAARTVAIVGDFNDWQVGSTPLRATAAGGAWTVEVPLAPGRHRYAFVVDGVRWMPDPAAPTAPGDDFGTPSSVVTVVERRT